MADNPFQSVFDKFKKGHRLSTESAFVFKIGKKVGIPVRAIRQSYKAATGFGTPSLLWFCARYRSFPLFLGYRQTQHARDGLREFSRNFLKSTVFQSWEAVKEQNDDPDRETGCLFRWPRFGNCIAFTTPSPDLSSPGTTIHVKLKTGQIFVIQHWKEWLDKLEWTPTDSEREDGS